MQERLASTLRCLADRYIHGSFHSISQGWKSRAICFRARTISLNERAVYLTPCPVSHLRTSNIEGSEFV